MKLLASIIPAILLLSACAPPIHDDPNAINQVADTNAVWAGSKDSHFEGKQNEFIDELMLNGNTAMGGTLDGLVYSQAPGCAVGVLKNGDITYLQAYGYASQSEDWTVETISPVASISKTFTTVGVMKLVEAGLVELDEPIDSYLGNAGAFSGVTLEQLLSMDAGVPAGSPPWTSAPSCPNSMPAGASVDWCLSHPRVAFDEIKNDMVLGPQTTKYSNISIMAAAAVIDQVSYDSKQIDPDHQGYEPFIWHQLGHWANNHNVDGELTSLALTHSWRHGDITPYADGFNCGGACGNFPPSAPAWIDAGLHEGWWSPAGGWSLTIGDLARFVALIDNENVITGDSWDEMFDKRNDVFDAITGIDYGLGTIVENWDFVSQNEDIVWHGGDLKGYSSIWFYSKKGSSSYGVAMICNSNGGEADSFVLREYAQEITDFAWSGGDIYPKLDVVIGFATQYQAEGDYVIDQDMITLLSPKSLHIPIQFKHDVVISASRVDHSNMAYRLNNARIEGGKIKPLPGLGYSLGTNRFVPERFSRTEKTDISLMSSAGRVDLRDAVLDIGTSKNARYLTESLISGVLDLRQLQKLDITENWPMLCDIAKAEDDVSCTPCDDGRKACLPVTYEFQARRFSGKSTD